MDFNLFLICAYHVVRNADVAPNMFQINHKEGILYIACNSPGEKDGWMRDLKSLTDDSKNVSYQSIRMENMSKMAAKTDHAEAKEQKVVRHTQDRTALKTLFYATGNQLSEIQKLWNQFQVAANDESDHSTNSDVEHQLRLDMDKIKVFLEIFYRVR